VETVFPTEWLNQMTPLSIRTVLDSVTVNNQKRQVKQVAIVKKTKMLTNITKQQKPDRFWFTNTIIF